MPVAYESWLVLLSIGMAIQGAYVGLSLAVQIGAAARLAPPLVAGGRGVLARGRDLDHALHRHAGGADAVPGRLSGIPDAVVVSGLRARGRRRGLCHEFRAADAGAADIIVLPDGRRHFLDALHRHERAQRQRLYGPRPDYVAASMAIAIAASGLALWLATGRGGRPPLILSAIAFGVAVSGMHYTAMQGLTLLPFAASAADAPALSSDLLAIVVAIVAFCLSGIFLLFLAPDRARSASGAITAETVRQLRRSDWRRRRQCPRMRRRTPATALALRPNSAAALMRRSAAWAPRRGALPAICRSSATARTHFVAVEDVVAIHANAHYTYVFNGTDKLFCPLAIGDVNPGSTIAASCASIAATSSISTAWSATSAPATTSSSKWPRATIMSCR